MSFRTCLAVALLSLCSVVAMAQNKRISGKVVDANGDPVIGDRFNDLRRWYPKDAGKIIADNQKGAFIEYRGNVVPGGWCDIPGNGIADRYAKTRGFWMLSNAEIELSDGVLEQTPGFGPDDNWLFGNGNLPYPTKY